jgi:hypothetical protein
MSTQYHRKSLTLQLSAVHAGWLTEKEHSSQPSIKQCNHSTLKSFAIFEYQQMPKIILKISPIEKDCKAMSTDNILLYSFMPSTESTEGATKSFMDGIFVDWDTTSPKEYSVEHQKNNGQTYTLTNHPTKSHVTLVLQSGSGFIEHCDGRKFSWIRLASCFHLEYKGKKIAKLSGESNGKPTILTPNCLVSADESFQDDFWFIWMSAIVILNHLHKKVFIDVNVYLAAGVTLAIY